ncbi:MAG: hypothetical protein J0M00_16770 [Burkholderiales bacterium]|nr:hypothetical protein [Burkholderiales bacterium]
MFDPDSTASPDVKTIRIALFVAEKLVKDLREQLTLAGDGAVVAQHDREQSGPTEIDCL